ncbi:MAG: MaoC family dehydratase [Bacteriovorax sp.]|nr:MaoC family dehydratase [Bacteriovorax sp.]
MNKYSFAEIKINQSADFHTIVTLEMMASFLAISGDCNPLHLNMKYAQDSGFSSQVVYGLLTGSFLSTLVGVYLPGENALFLGADISFSKPVYVGDQLTVTGIVIEKNETFKQLKIKASIVNQEGCIVLRAKLKVGIRE